MIWHCRCDCGNEINVSYNNLMYCGQQSCGCKKKEHDKALAGYLVHVDGTSIDALESDKIPQNNTTGVKVVYRIKGHYLKKSYFNIGSIPSAPMNPLRLRQKPAKKRKNC